MRDGYPNLRRMGWWLSLCGLMVLCWATMEDSFVVSPHEAYTFYPLGMEESVQLQSVSTTSSGALHFGSDFQRLHATRAFAAGDLLLTLDDAHAITTHVLVDELPQIAQVEFSYADEPFVLWLLYHRARGADSPHFPFLSSLPRHPVHPLLFTTAQWNLLPVDTESIRINQIINEQRDALLDASRRLFISLESQMPEVYDMLGDLTFQEYLDAHVVISDLIRRSGDTAFLFPALLAAHAPTGARLQLEDGRVLLRAPHDLARGEQVTLDYGNLTNTQLFLRHGLIQENNQAACAPFTLRALSPFWGLVAEKVFGRSDAENYSHCLSIHFEASNPVLRELRAIVATHEEMDRLGDILAGHPLSITNEARMLRSLYIALSSQTFAELPEEDPREDPALRLWRHYANDHRHTVQTVLQRLFRLWNQILTEGL